MPMTDDKIKEIYLYAIHARQGGQAKIPVYIFPFKMTDENFRIHSENFNRNKDLVNFWTNLKSGFDKFQREKKELKCTISKTGDYIF